MEVGPPPRRAASSKAAIPAGDRLRYSADEGLHFSIEYLPPLVTLTIAACLAS